VPAAEAERIGLANKVVPRVELEKTLGEWAGRLAKMPTRAIAFTKWLTNRALETDRAGSFWDEAYAQELVTRTEDMQEGRASFIERRPPEFKGW
jgi:2-(1,2-epoxy-1,2-dihydrophenyl)acetyl-CoA isomerase